MLHQRWVPYLFVFLKKKISNGQIIFFGLYFFAKGPPQYFGFFRAAEYADLTLTLNSKISVYQLKQRIQRLNLLLHFVLNYFYFRLAFFDKITNGFNYQTVAPQYFFKFVAVFTLHRNQQSARSLGVAEDVFLILG